jgi:hypothetical protein
MSLDELNAEQDRISAEIDLLRQEARVVADVRRERIAAETATAKLGLHRLKPEEARAIGIDPETLPKPQRARAGVATVGANVKGGEMK